MKNDLTQARKLIKECLETQNPYLEIGNCGITDLDDLPELFECTHLETLIVSNQWWDENGFRQHSSNVGESNILYKIPVRINNLRELKTLVLSGFNRKSWSILKIENISDLKNLETLNLRSNKISKIENLGTLSELKTLGLSGNRITKIENLANLTNLRSLSLSVNQVSKIENLDHLSKLRNLGLRSNNIHKIENLSELRRLSNLRLNNNKIEKLQNLENLSDLEILDLRYNKISKIENLEKLSSLRQLELRYNRIYKIENLKKLEKLSSLGLRGNSINDITVAANLNRLVHLDLESNYISEVPFEVIKNNISELKLKDNPIHTPPIEIVNQGSWQAMLDWYAANKKKLSEIKVILIGEPGAGKTSLLKKLKNDEFNEKEPQTDGINIEDIEFENCETFKKHKNLHGITGHFWDFGGQEIMNATHQFFLTNRSVYVLLLDARKDTHVSAQVRQWVKRIKATGGNSPIIVVANQIDVNPGFGFENERELQEEFPEIKAFIKASCADGSQIEIIKQKLAELIPQAELFDTEIDERWILIKDKLQEEIDNKNDKYLDERRFNEICEEFWLIESRQKQNAIQFLHDLGILLHFKEIDTYKYYVLDPYWITYGVYQILTSDKAGKLNGLVPMSELDYIINEEEDKKESYRNESQEKINYLSNDQRFLVDVLHQFKLSFYQPDRKKFIIPDLLDTVEPVYVTDPIRKASGSIHFVYEYEYLLKSIMPRIMVEQHELIKERWRTGCVLQKGNCQAVITSYQQRITISVAGDHPEKREFMSILRHQLDTINSSLTEPPKMLIPLPGAKGFASYKTLLILQKKGRREFEIFEPDYEEFNISTLLEGIDDVDKLDQLRELIVKNHSEAKKDRKQMLGNQMVIKNKANEIKEDTNAIKTQLEENFQYLISQPGNEELQKYLLPEIAKLTGQQTEEIVSSIMETIDHQVQYSEEVLDEKLLEIYRNLKKTSNHELKLKLSVPLLKQLGIDLHYQFNIRKWALEKYEKYSWEVFRMMGGFKSE